MDETISIGVCDISTQRVVCGRIAPMRYTRPLGVATLCALAAAGFFIAVKLTGPLVYLQFETLRHLASGDSSWDAYYPTSWHIVEPLIAAAIGFGVGAWWTLRRQTAG